MAFSSVHIHHQNLVILGSPSRQKREAEKPVPPFGGDTCPVSGVSCGKMYTNDIATLVRQSIFDQLVLLMMKIMVNHTRKVLMHTMEREL